MGGNWQSIGVLEFLLGWVLTCSLLALSFDSFILLFLENLGYAIRLIGVKLVGNDAYY